jgi:uracil phosphoribosyltransferase
MEGLTIVDHPLVQHKLTLIRDKDRSTKSFRELLKEIGMLLCYEVTRDLPLTNVEIETPLARMTSPRISGKKLVFALFFALASHSPKECSISFRLRA